MLDVKHIKQQQSVGKKTKKKGFLKSYCQYRSSKIALSTYGAGSVKKTQVFQIKFLNEIISFLTGRVFLTVVLRDHQAKTNQHRVNAV